MNPRRLLIVDDHQIMRDGLRLLLKARPEFVIVGEAFDAEGGWTQVRETKPDLAILDLEIPGEGGMALAQRIRREYPEIKIVILSGHADGSAVQEAMLAGVNGYVSKRNAGTQLIAALHAVLAGQVFLCPEASTYMVRAYCRQVEATAPAPSRALSSRETDVLRRIADGQSTKEIAFALSVSTKTVETHRLHLLAKLNLRSVADLTKYAVREGLTTL